MRISAGIVSYAISILHGLGSVPGDNIIDRLNIFYALDYFFFSFLFRNNRNLEIIESIRFSVTFYTFRTSYCLLQWLNE